MKMQIGLDNLSGCPVLAESREGDKMKLTMKKLETWKACTVGKEWFAGQAETDGKKIVETLIIEKHLDWANWLIVRLLKRADKIRYAIYAAEQVVDIFERKYPEDKRPRQAIDAAKTYLNNPTEANKRAAYAAAAYAAYAADAAMKEKIIRYGLTLVK